MRIDRAPGSSAPRIRSRIASTAAYWSRAPAGSPASPVQKRRGALKVYGNAAGPFQGAEWECRRLADKQHRFSWGGVMRGVPCTGRKPAIKVTGPGWIAASSIRSARSA